MRIVMLSGGSGIGLWPLSNEIRSKQFIKIFRTQTGEYESMLQRVYRQIKGIYPEAEILIATSSAQAAIIRNQLGESVDISIEPMRSNTFPAMVLASVYIRDLLNGDEEEPIVFCPVDCWVEDGFFETFSKLEEIVRDNKTELALVGTPALHPSENYGYVIPEEKVENTKADKFIEKPDSAFAKELIDKGALWNCGVYCCKIAYLVKKAHAYFDFKDYYSLYQDYNGLPAKSFDREVSEKESGIAVICYDGTWNDLGTWDTLAETTDNAAFGEVQTDQLTEDTYILNELGIPMLVMGTKDLIVTAASDGILVADKNRVSEIKPLIGSAERMIRYAEKSWGNFRIIDVGDGSITAKVQVRSGMRMSYHSHKHRDEMWVIVSGKGRTIVDGMEQIVKPGDVVTMQAGCRHTIIADSEIELIEVQMGKEISVHDKKKYALGS